MAYKLTLFFVLALMAANGIDFHSFYVSITYLKIEGESLTITQRIFRDDLELALRDYTKNPQLNLSVSDQEPVSEYLQKVTSIEINHKKVSPKLESLSIEGSGPTCTVQCIFTAGLPIESLRNIKFDTKLLLQQYDDQVNMVHFVSGKSRTSKNLDAKITSFSISDPK